MDMRWRMDEREFSAIEVESRYKRFVRSYRSMHPRNFVNTSDVKFLKRNERRQRFRASPVTTCRYGFDPKSASVRHRFSSRFMCSVSETRRGNKRRSRQVVRYSSKRYRSRIRSDRLSIDLTMKLWILSKAPIVISTFSRPCAIAFRFCHSSSRVQPN